MSPYLVGMDSGTQSVRVIVFDLEGRVVAEGSARHDPIAYPRPGEAEQNPRDLWDKLCQASRQAMNSLPEDGEKLAAACIVAQRSVVVPVAHDGSPLRTAFSWLDKRRTEQLEDMPGISAVQRERRACSKANWLMTHQPELYAKTRRFLSASGWLIYKLTGQYRDSIGGLGGVFPLDVIRLAWSEDPGLYQLLGMPPECLPEILPPGSILGHISQEAAHQTGLPEGLVLVAGTGDKSCEMLGAGAISPEQGYISYGTMAALQVKADSPRFSDNEKYWTTSGAMPGTWNLEFGIECGYLMVNWFCEQFAMGGRESAIPFGASIEKVMGEQAAKIPAGAGGLVLAPYWSHTGDASEEKSVLLGLENSHTPAHLFRAILEGIAFGLREGMDTLTKDTGLCLQEAFIGGGGAQSDLAVQITADVLGLPVVRVQTIQTCALGAAIEAAVGVGLFQSYAEAVRTMSSREHVFQPDPDNCKVYDAIYTQIYRKLYPALRQVFGEFRQIFSSREAGDQYVAERVA